jgi:hypothetical protein
MAGSAARVNRMSCAGAPTAVGEADPPLVVRQTAAGVVEPAI